MLATTSNRHMIEEMDMINIFDSEIAINTLISLDSIMAVIESVDLFKPSDQGYQEIQDLLERKVTERNLRLEIGIKRLLSLIEMARQDVDNTGPCLLSAAVLARADSEFFLSRYLSAGKLVKSLESAMLSAQTDSRRYNYAV